MWEAESPYAPDDGQRRYYDECVADGVQFTINGWPHGNDMWCANEVISFHWIYRFIQSEALRAMMIEWPQFSIVLAIICWHMRANLAICRMCALTFDQSFASRRALNLLSLIRTRDGIHRYLNFQFRLSRQPHPTHRRKSRRWIEEGKQIGDQSQRDVVLRVNKIVCHSRRNARHRTCVNRETVQNINCVRFNKTYMRRCLGMES